MPQPDSIIGGMKGLAPYLFVFAYLIVPLFRFAGMAAFRR
jgi:hypothetical protein